MHIVMGIALAGAAGWNAFLPLLMLAFAHRLSGRIPIDAPYTFISSVGGLIVLLALLPIELFLDKGPGWDAMNDRYAAFYRPLAGALIMLATTKGTGLPAVLAAIIGAAAAYGMHALKTRYRRPLSRILGGIGVPAASLGEDFVVALCAFLALLLPVVGVILLALAALCMWWVGGVTQRRAQQPRAEAAPATTAQP